MAVLGVPVTLFLWPFAVILVVVLILKIAVGATVKSSWYKSTFAAYQDRWIIHSKEILHQSKLELFAYLSEGLKEVSGDVLEIGVGPGANFDYYPQGTSLIAVDENPHVEKHFRQNLERSGKRVHLKAFVVACAEDMSFKGQVGVADGSVAAVVFTKLLCSLSEDNIRKILREVKRVLKPGGRCYFLEHVADDPGTLRYYLQRLFSMTRLWPTLFNGCCCDRDIIPFLREHHFKHVSFQKISTDCSPRMRESPTVYLLHYFVATFLYGYVEK